jgi:uncharacterized protein YndB with AHSA1/START domain
VIPDAIEKEILIHAPVHTVYRVVTEPAQISQWFADAAELDPVPGGEGRLTFEDRATNRPMAVRLRVEAAEPPRRFVFRWDYPDGEQPHQGNSRLVEFTLTAEGTGTRLSVAESGFAAGAKPESDRAAYFDIYDKGWDAHLASLRGYVTRSPETWAHSGERRSAILGHGLCRDSRGLPSEPAGAAAGRPGSSRRSGSW